MNYAKLWLRSDGQKQKHTMNRQIQSDTCTAASQMRTEEDEARENREKKCFSNREKFRSSNM